MHAKSAASGRSSVQRNKINIIKQREIEPLLARARETLVFYSQALDCSVMVLDGHGYPVETPRDTRSWTQFCELCEKYFCNPSRKKKEAAETGEYPCAEIHKNALDISRHAAGPYIYTCAAGFVYWTSPVFQRGSPGLRNDDLTASYGKFRNERYTGALTAGQVILRGHETAVEKSEAFSGDTIKAKKIRGAFEKIPEKSHDEIEAMARLLGVCAEEISEKEEDFGKMIRRIAWQKKDMPGEKKQRPPKNSAKKNDPVPEENDSEYPMDKERMLLAAFRRGDNETGENILRELMEHIIAVMPGNFEVIRFRATELMVLLSRAAAGTSDSGDLLEANNRYIRRIQESKTTEELIESLYIIANRMAGNIFSFQGIRHASVLRKAERFIWKNYTRKISLESIAKASGLSAPYFSSVFKEEMGENLSGYLNRLRVERAATLLTETGKSLTEIAGLCGFEDQSWFSKIFKKFTGMSPGKYRENSGNLPAYKDML